MSEIKTLALAAVESITFEPLPGKAVALTIKDIEGTHLTILIRDRDQLIEFNNKICDLVLNRPMS